METWDILLDARLVDVYEVDEATLQTNRKGRMTEKQAQRLRQMRWRIIRRYSVSAMLALLLLIGTGFLIIGGILGLLKGLLQFIACLLILIQVGRMVKLYWLSEAEIEAAKVIMYPGRLNKVVWFGIRILFCERGEFYHLPNNEWHAFDHYGRYRVYATPHTKIILAAQPVHRNEPLPEAWRRRDD